jgi:hypothetical protein
LKAHLFYTFLALFVITALLVLLGITSVLPIRDGYLTPLMGAFIVESAAAVIALFRGADFFSTPVLSGPQPSEELAADMKRMRAENAKIQKYLCDVRLAFETSIFRATHTAPTPETDLMVLIGHVQHWAPHATPEVIDRALSVIVDHLEDKPRVNGPMRTALVKLGETLRPQNSALKERLRDALTLKSA